MKELTYPEEIFQALEDIHTKFIIPNGKVDRFVSWYDLDRDLTDYGFEIYPYKNDESPDQICLYGSIGTTYITNHTLIFFIHGGGIPPSYIDDYINLTEEQHFQLGTTTFLAGVFEFNDFKKIHEYFKKIT